MLRNYFTLALRNLLKRKIYSGINILGLSVGVAVCLVILKYVAFELSYDSYHKNADRIYRTLATAYQNGEFRGTYIVSGYALGPALVADVPEVETYVRTHPMYGDAVVSYKERGGDEKAFLETGIQWVDSTFLDVFTYRAVAGNLSTALDDPNSVVVTRTVAEKYFGKHADAIGKSLVVSGGWSDGNYEVSAVVEDVPQNSTFNFEILLPIHNLINSGQYTQDDGWGWNNFVTFVVLHPHADIRAVDAKMPAFVKKYVKDPPPNSQHLQQFQPLRDIHLHPGLNLEASPTISASTIYFFVLISLFILAIAWINYINLSTARAMERAREVGIKKAIGAHKAQLIGQFLFESVLVNFVSVALALLIAVALLPVLGNIVGKNLAFDFADYRLWLILGALFVSGALVSGAYPAFVLSSFNTTHVLKGKTEKVSGSFSLRKALVVFQFAASLILIAGTFAIYRQVVFMRQQDKGLTMDQMLIVNAPKVLDYKGSTTRLLTLKEKWKNTPGVLSVTTSGAIPGGGYNWGTGMRRDGTQETESRNGNVVWIDPDFVPTYNIQLLAGRNFNLQNRSDMESVLVNEAALATFGLGAPEEALNERIILGGDTVAILGVLKNYHWNSLKTEVTPWLFKADTVSRRAFSVHLSGTDIPGTIRQLEKQYHEAFAGNPFDYYFLDEFFNNQYKSEQQFAKIFSLFSILAILIACLGLGGLASFTTTLKLKEIGVRKVLGASVKSILSLLSWQFLKLVLIASLVAIPLAWWGIDSWLNEFAFRIGLSWDLFVVPVVALNVLALAAVSFQILRGANSNPATILRNE